MAKRRPALTPEQRARKQERDRAYRARKVQEAKAAGLPSSVGYGHGRRAGLPSVAELRQAGVLPSRPSSRPPRVLRRTEGPGGSASFRTGSKASLQRILRDAAAKGQNVAIRGTFDTSQGWRQVTLDGSGRGGRDFIGDLAAGGTAGGGDTGRDRLGRIDTPTARQGRQGGPVVEIRTGAGGISAADVWAAWLAYDGDWWDFLADWADAEYV